MKTTFAHTCSLYLLRHYPRAWRERYADEAAAVLEERPATARTLFDLSLGLLDAYLHAELFTERKFVMLQRLRNSQLTIFRSFILFAVFWVLYIFSTAIYQAGLPIWDVTSATQNSLFVFRAVRVIGVLAILSTLLGGGTLLALALKQAIARDKRSLPSFACILSSLFLLALTIGLIITEELVPVTWMWVWHLNHFIGLLLPISLFSFVVLTLLGNIFRFIQGIKSAELSWRFMLPTLLPVLVIVTLVGVTAFTLSRGSIYMLPRPLFFLALMLPLSVVLGTIFGSVNYLTRKIRRLTLSPHLLRLTFVPAALTCLAMFVTFGLLVFQVVSIDSSINAHGLTLLIVPFLNILVICFAFPTLFACISLWRGFKAQRELALAV